MADTSEIDEFAALPKTPKRPRRVLDLISSAACFHSIFGDGEADDLSVGERLSLISVLLRQEPETPKGEMILYRLVEDKSVELGSFTAQAALAAMQAGRLGPTEPKRRRRTL